MADNKQISRERFLELVSQYKDEFYRYVSRMAWNQSDVEDIFSEAILVAWQKRAKFRPGTNFRAWVYKILTNKCYVANRRAKRNSIDLDSVSEAEYPAPGNTRERSYEDHAWFLQQVDDDLYQSMKLLREPEMACLMLRATSNCSYKEIAQVLDIPVGTVMTHLARGRAKLRDELARRVEEHEGRMSPRVLEFARATA